MVALLLIVTGCDTHSVIPDIDSNLITSPAQETMTLDDYYAEVARQVPGFGGLYLDEQGFLNIHLSQPSIGAKTQAEAAQAVLGVLNGLGPVPSEVRQAPPHVLEGKYDFIQLRDWKKLAVASLTRKNLVFVDADEIKNRLRIGVANEGAVQQIKAELKELGIPEDAMLVEVVPRIAPTVSLQDKHRPVEGGFEITFTSLGALCTLGLSVDRSGEIGFITNSHCSGVTGAVDGTQYYQDSWGDSNEFIGTELVDPPFTRYGTGPIGTNGPRDDGFYHRKSDALYADYGPNMYTNDINFGKIARTNSRATGDNEGSLTRNGAFSITADAWDHLQHIAGLELNKVGRTSGWTYGQITATCLDIPHPSDPNSRVVDCEYQVSALAEGGDSGSPVFHWSGSGNNITLYGLLWGAACEAVNQFNQCVDWSPPFTYSTIGDVDAELRTSGTNPLITHY